MMTPGEKSTTTKTTNKHAPVIGLLAKIMDFHIFADRSLKLLQ